MCWSYQRRLSWKKLIGSSESIAPSSYTSAKGISFPSSLTSIPIRLGWRGALRPPLWSGAVRPPRYEVTWHARGGGQGREAARACGGLDWRASEPSGKGAAVLNGLYEARQRFKWERNRTEFPGNERKTIFQVDDQTRYKYDTLMGRMPID